MVCRTIVAVLKDVGRLNMVLLEAASQSSCRELNSEGCWQLSPGGKLLCFFCQLASNALCLGIVASRLDIAAILVYWPLNSQGRRQGFQSSGLSIAIVAAVALQKQL